MNIICYRLRLYHCWLLRRNESVLLKKGIHERRGSEKQHKEGNMGTKQENTERKNVGRSKRKKVKCEGKNRVQSVGGK